MRSYASAEAFLKLDDPHIPGCVVLDVQMPGMSGIELMRELASRSNRLPVIFATAQGDIDMAVQALKEAGVPGQVGRDSNTAVGKLSGSSWHGGLSGGPLHT